MFEKTEQQQIFDTVFKQIEEAKNNKWNLLLPSITVSPSPESLFVPSLERVDIITGEGSRDYYKPSSGNGFRLHATALNRIAIAGELKWNSEHTGYFKDTDGTLIFRAVGGVVNSAGNIHMESGYYALNMDDIKEDLIDKYTADAKKLKKGQDYIDYCVNRDYRQKRQFKLQHCETSAKNRVIRKIFNVTNEYSMEQLKRPFMVLKFSIYMDYKDPIVKQMVLGMKIQAALGVYGITPQSTIAAPQNLGIPAPQHMEPFDPDDDPNLPDFPDDEEECPPDEFNDVSPGEIDFANSDDKDQIRTLITMAKQRGINLSESRLAPDQAHKRLDLFKYLHSRPKPEPEKDDIPF